MESAIGMIKKLSGAENLHLKYHLGSMAPRVSVSGLRPGQSLFPAK